jgi:hypothetical protein
MGAALTPGRATPSPLGPFLVELAGSAGAGKSTIFTALLRRDARVERVPVLGHTRWAPLLVWHVLAVLVTLVRRRALGRQWSRDRILTMAYLQALPRVLASRADRAGRVVVFDQGPLFFLTRPVLRDERLRPWWDRTFRRWTGLLDLVVLLDAPDPVLVERINMRPKHHRMKGNDDEAALAFVAEGRAAFEQALATCRPAPATLRFDTSRVAPDEVVEAIVAALPARAAIGAAAP